MYYFILLIALLSAELLYFRLADNFNIIDKPNERSSHSRITLRGGGIVFPVGILIYFFSDGFEYLWFVSGFLLIAGVSFVDDIRGVSQKVRLLFHMTAILLLFCQWELFSLSWYYLFLVLILCIGIINAYNFMDGINGITGGYSLAVVGMLWYIDRYVVSFIDPGLLYVTGLSLLVFNFFNFRKKAKCFAGDVGSVSMAFVILFILGKLILRTQDLSYMILLVVYGIDSLLTIVHRIILRENIFEAHRKHAYQLLANELKWPHTCVATIYMVVQILIFVGYVWLHEWKFYYLMGVILTLSFIYCGLIGKYCKLHRGGGEQAF